MPAARSKFNFLMSPWDLDQPPGASGPFGGIVIDPALTATDEQLGAGAAIEVSPEFAYGLFARVSIWRFSAHLTFSNLPFGTAEGDVAILCPAIMYNGVEMTGEKQITKHGGWYGKLEGFAPWTFTTLDPEGVEDPVIDMIDPGPMELSIWPAISPIRGGGPHGGGVLTLPAPNLRFFEGIPGTESGIVFGQTSGADSCAVTPGSSLITHAGSFDGTGATTFTYQLGAPIAMGGGGGSSFVSGTATLEAYAWHPYQAEDDDLGPIYDATTGEWLREPPGL
jgi:hypothetical protein